ncbi:hypothetical protein BVX98_04820, partial [bacterium F11]
FEAALIEYKKALEEEPDNAIVLLKAARAELALKRGDDARDHLRRAVKSNPNYGTPHIELAKMVPIQESLSLLRTANDINPFDPQIHKLKALIYRELGHEEEFEREKIIFEGLIKGLQ